MNWEVFFITIFRNEKSPFTLRLISDLVAGVFSLFVVLGISVSIGEIGQGILAPVEDEFSAGEVHQRSWVATKHHFQEVNLRLEKLEVVLSTLKDQICLITNQSAISPEVTNLFLHAFLLAPRLNDVRMRLGPVGRTVFYCDVLHQNLPFTKVV
jgi:hypothetical protein